jgi:hypothetical protein
MYRWIRLVPVACLVLTACGGTRSTSPRQTAAPAPSAVAGGRPVIEHAAIGGTWLLSGAATASPDGLHLFPLVWITDQDEHPRIAHFTSRDARTWTAADDPVFTGVDALELGRPGAVPSSVLRQPDGGWAMYGGGRTARSDRPVVWRATAASSDGPWQVDPQPVLVPGDVTAWDGRGVDHPSVIAAGEGFLMAYGGAGFADRNAGHIGFARSVDGRTWTRADGDPLAPGICNVDARSLVEPHLATEGGELVLLFGAMEVGGDRMVVLRASSEDGGWTWECDPANPVLREDDFPQVAGLHSMVALDVDGSPGLLVETLGDGWSDLWLALPGNAR